MEGLCNRERECAADKNCPDSLPVCPLAKVASPKCVQCVENHHCLDGLACIQHKLALLLHRN